MKKIFSISIIIVSTIVFLQSCEAQKVVVNREVDTAKDGKMLLGTQTSKQFYKEPYSEWYNKEHDDYQIDQASVEQLKKEKIPSYNITVFLGTWCEDSHREFPRLMKILEAVKYPEDRLTIIAVNRKKESPSGEEAKYNIQKVPTIILSKYGKELGRIIEFPESGYLEKDLLQIIEKNKSSIGDLFKK